MLHRYEKLNLWNTCGASYLCVHCYRYDYSWKHIEAGAWLCFKRTNDIFFLIESYVSIFINTFFHLIKKLYFMYEGDAFYMSIM